MRALKESGNPHLRVMVLSPRSRQLLKRPIRGHGGYQSLLRRLVGSVEGPLLFASIDDINALVRRSTGLAFRRLGGFQQVALSLLMDIVNNEEAYPERPTGQLSLFAAPAPRRRPASWRVIRGGRL